MKLYDLTVEYRTAPQGLGSPAPRFGWKIAGPDEVPFHLVQTAYRVQVWTAVGDAVWDSGRVLDDASFHIAYAGPPLAANGRYVWQVTVETNKLKQPLVSEKACFSMGKLDEPWQAEWIGPRKVDMPSVWSVPLLRREIEVTQGLTHAYAYACAQGWYSLTVNGCAVTEHVLAPGWTCDDRRLCYERLDLTPHLKPGKNVLGVQLAKGWYADNFFLDWGRSEIDLEAFEPPAFLGEFRLEYTDKTTVIPTDAAWTWHNGPVTFTSLYAGEDYNATLELPGWDTPGFEATGWQPVQVSASAGPIQALLPTGQATGGGQALVGGQALSEAQPLDATQALEAAQTKTAKVWETVTPTRIFTTPKGETVVDMGQNMVGWLRLCVPAHAGDKISLRLFEELSPEGNVYLDNLNFARAGVEHICAEGLHNHAPQFTYYGFRYVHVLRWPGEFALEQMTGEVVYADMPRTGWFECSDADVNQLYNNTLWSQKGNFVDVPTDCPQRDERLGWTGDAQVFARTAAFNYGVNPLFAKWLRDVALEQNERGSVPYVVPDVLHTADGSAAWGDAAVICPWTMYLCYADHGILRAQYASMKAWVEYIKSCGDDPYLWNTGFHFGDWLSLGVEEGSNVGSTDPHLVAQAMYAHSAALLAKTAGVLGYTEDAATYEALTREVKQAFCQEYLTPNGRVAVPTQTAHILALHFELCEKQHEPRILASLIKLLERSKFHLATGFVGTPYLCHVLTRHGRHDIAAKIFLQRDYPSWLYPVSKGATTIWERWDGIKPDGSYQDSDMNSFNHYSYGSICDWAVQCVAGLDIDPEAPGYRRAVLHPRVTPGLTHANAAYESMLGRFECGWAKEGARLTVTVVIPPNAQAILTLEGAQGIDGISLNGSFSVVYPDVQWEIDKNGGVKVRLGSGKYVFSYEAVGDIL